MATLDTFGLLAYLERCYPGIQFNCSKAVLVHESNQPPRIELTLSVREDQEHG